ncbi:MAG: hypothetical protein IJ373_04740 [Clostridia bacterium]|nr:hypothetical protein [Clostridia bacterium]
MTVKECMQLAAAHLGMEETVETYFNGTGTVDDNKKCELLLTCYNIVENELALDYFPLIAEDTIDSEGGVINFTSLKKDAVRITKVTDEWENSVPFQIFPSYLKTQPGKVLVRYTYAPVKKTSTSASDFSSHVSARLISYGIAAEYTMATGFFEDASVWDKKYKESIRAAYRLQKCERIRSRRWV